MHGVPGAKARVAGEQSSPRGSISAVGSFSTYAYRLRDCGLLASASYAWCCDSRSIRQEKGTVRFVPDEDRALPLNAPHESLAQFAVGTLRLVLQPDECAGRAGVDEITGVRTVFESAHLSSNPRKEAFVGLGTHGFLVSRIRLVINSVVLPRRYLPVKLLDRSACDVNILAHRARAERTRSEPRPYLLQRKVASGRRLQKDPHGSSQNEEL